MAVREVLQIGHPILMQPAAPIDMEQINTAEVQSWIDDMIDTMRNANGAGIAANQIGVPHRAFVIEIDKNPRYPYMPKVPLTVVISPELKLLGDKTFLSNEGCLSVPQMRGDVERHLQLEVSYYDRHGEHHQETIKGYSACVWQHEYDHLDGMLFPHRVSDQRSLISWAVFSEFKQQAYAKRVEALVSQWGS